MMGITENAAYLNGLFDGYELDSTSKIVIKLLYVLVKLLVVVLKSLNFISHIRYKLK